MRVFAQVHEIVFKREITSGSLFTKERERERVLIFHLPMLDIVLYSQALM